MMMGVGGARPAMPVDFGWKDYVEVFNAGDRVRVAAVGDIFEDGYEYRLIFQAVSTTEKLSNGYNQLTITVAGYEKYWVTDRSLAYINNSYLYGAVHLRGFGSDVNYYFVETELSKLDGTPNDWNYSHYAHAYGVDRIRFIRISANVNSLLLGRCMLQRRRIST